MTATSTSATAPSKNVFRLHGVNVLNRKNVDSISRLTALERRRATHILDERQRRDTMNQLLGELANLVRESAAEAQAQQQQESQAQHKQLNADGTEKRPPVKSNSITTLRNAIAEIRRLRATAGMETLTPPCAASLAVVTPSGSRSSSPTAPQNKQYQQQQQPLPALAPLAPQYSSNNNNAGAPMSKTFASQTHASMASYNQSQLQSPPLSPSSPALHQYPSSCPVSPPMMPMHGSHQGPTLPSLFATSSYSSYQSQSSQPKQSYYQPSQSYTSPRYEPYSRPSSPSFSNSVHLPQPYLPLPSTYQTSSVSSYGHM
ncbi:MAG: hypothetical protein J3Q66DRAFT_323315 [Benniella sp.]|nr:MAG: hypothetical protein J3Q66DRAFT_323315 [Benniella sp.]